MVFNVGENEIIVGRKRPVFSKTYKTNNNIAAGAISNEVFIEEENEWRHAPFDTILITNLDVVDLAILLDSNPDNAISVSKGQTVGGSDQNFRNFQVENLDGAVEHTAGKIRILVQNTKNPDKK